MNEVRSTNELAAGVPTPAVGSRSDKLSCYFKKSKRDNTSGFDGIYHQVLTTHGAYERTRLIDGLASCRSGSKPGATGEVTNLRSSATRANVFGGQASK